MPAFSRSGRPVRLAGAFRFAGPAAVDGPAESGPAAAFVARRCKGLPAAAA